uniref:KIX domain-containing protein n=1 Tax=Caenorhabditis tropicalis TaxID=1561998 RepID=A0A1I7UFA8_9PELO
MPPIESIPEKVNRYTELLLVSENKYEIENALLRLFQIETSIRVYEKCRLEYILRKRFDGNIDYLYQVNRLFKKIAQLRRKEQKIIE